MPPDCSAYVLPLRGSLTTASSEETRAAVMQALSNHDSVILDCADATEIDVAFLQILIAAGRTAAQSHKRLEFARAPDGLLADALRRCGFPPPPATATSLAEVLSL